MDWQKEILDENGHIIDKDMSKMTRSEKARYLKALKKMTKHVIAISAQPRKDFLHSQDMQRLRAERNEYSKGGWHE